MGLAHNLFHQSQHWQHQNCQWTGDPSCGESFLGVATGYGLHARGLGKDNR
jgi:hypothetical protein